VQHTTKQAVIRLSTFLLALFLHVCAQLYVYGITDAIHIDLFYTQDY